MFEELKKIEIQSRLLEPGLDDVEEWFKLLRVQVQRYLQNLNKSPASWALVEPKEREVRSKQVTFQDAPGSFHEGMLEMMDRIISTGLETAGPRYLAYIPGGGLPSAAFADFISAVTNRYAGMYHASPGSAEIENEVIRFFVKIFGMPESAWGTLTSGGSIANLTGLLAARETRFRDQRALSTLYLTQQCHSSIDRALHILGIDPKLIRLIPTDSKFRMDTERLAAHIARDQKSGLKPWIIISSLGTTNTGSVDSVAELVQIKKRFDMWLHIDAAYGGFFILNSSEKKFFEGISEADSIVLDPHKGMFMPYGTGAVLVRNGQILKQALKTDSPYLADIEDDRVKSPKDYSIELTRHFRAPRIFLSLRTFGVDAFRAALQEKLILARYAYEQLRLIPELEFACEPELSVVAFRVRGVDVKTSELLKWINDRRRVQLSSTTLNEKTYIRICVLSFRTHFSDVKECIEEIREGMRAGQGGKA